MTAPDHFEECWRVHHACALREIQRLTVEVAQLQSGVIEPDWMKRVREPGCIPCGDTQSGGYGTVILKLHSNGPTWSHHSDDPPTR